MGGLIAKKMGLPVRKFIISTNENDEVPEFLRTGIYTLINPSKNCISSAMNVGHPSNLARIVAFYGGIMDESGKIIKTPDLDQMRKELFAVSINDEDTMKVIEDAYRKYNLFLEPHGAIAWEGMKQYLRINKNTLSGKPLCISLETAHPAKFPYEIKQILNIEPPLAESMSGLEQMQENYISLENDYGLLKEFIARNLK
jgi:threonine synthase